MSEETKGLPRKNVTLRIRPNIYERWSKVAKRYGWSRSQMLEEILESVLPVLEEQDPKKLVQEVAKHVGETMQAISKAMGDQNGKDKR